MPDLSNFRPTVFSIQKSYQFEIYKGIYKTKITMRCETSTVNTSQIPTIYKNLKKMLPTVLRTKCFNENNYPFSIEVRRTEIAHLFEHILLEYICQARVARGERNVSVSGVTNWNWKKEPFGTFHITLDTGRDVNGIFNPAFMQTVKLFETLTSSTYEKQTAW